MKYVYKGIYPAFYACYDEENDVSEERTKQFCNYLFEKGVNGLYVSGSSGECLYHTIEERKATLKYVAEELQGKIPLIAHVGAPSTRDSKLLAKYASELGYDVLSAIPPIYYNLSEDSIYKYWTSIIEASDLSFIIYNIPQTTGYNLSIDLFKRMLQNERVIGLKNSSMPVLDIERFRQAANDDFIIFNGSDEQFIAGRLMGANGGIGGTYGVMPELFLQAEHLINKSDLTSAKDLQSDINNIIFKLISLEGHMYAVIKEVIKVQGVNIGSVREPLKPVSKEDMEEIEFIS